MIMKTTSNRLMKTLGYAVFGGLIMGPIVLQAQEAPAAPAADAPAAAAPNRPNAPLLRAAPQAPRGQDRPALAGNPTVVLRHLRQAAEHLSAAGCEDLARGLRIRIARLEASQKTPPSPGVAPQANSMMRGQSPSPNAAMGFGARQGSLPNARGDAAMGRVPRQQGALGAQRPFMRQRNNQSPWQGAAPNNHRAAAPSPDANAELLGEVRKMRAEMGELRNQVQRLQSSRAPASPQTPPAPPVAPSR